MRRMRGRENEKTRGREGERERKGEINRIAGSLGN
jgi:hypothetical protein